MLGGQGGQYLTLPNLLVRFLRSSPACHISFQEPICRHTEHLRYSAHNTTFRVDRLSSLDLVETLRANPHLFGESALRHAARHLCQPGSDNALPERLQDFYNHCVSSSLVTIHYHP